MNNPVFWVGQIPAAPLAMDVINQRGNSIDLSKYSEINLIMLGADNRRKKLQGNLTVNANTAQVIYNWAGQSLFDRPGEYLIQLELIGNGAVDYSSPQTFIVRQLGRGRL